MPVSPSSTIIVYRQGDADSESLADDYIAIYNLNTDFVSANAPTGQKVPIPCGSAEILADETTFNTQILTPLLNAINDLEISGRTIWTVVLGLSVPNGFYSGSDIISSVARIARINHSLSEKTPNPLFDRKTFKRFDAIDASVSLIVSSLDSPNLAFSKGLVTKSEIIKKQVFANGKFYFDPYSDQHGHGATEYEESLLSFQTRLLPLLNLEVFSTTFLDPYVDVIIPSVTDDSFIWSWFTDRGSLSFFKTTGAFRFFAYNADYDGAFTIRSLTERRWPVLYIRSGYAATAGAMSDPGNNALLSPTPFFTTLLRGGTLGEAFLFSQPYLDWTITLFGDPLMTVAFPSAIDPDVAETISEVESWRLMFQDLSKAIARYVHKTDMLEATRDKIVFSTDLATEVDLLKKSQQLLDMNSDTQRQGQFEAVTEAFLRHIQKRLAFQDISNPNPTVSDFLIEKDIQVSELVFDVQYDNNKLTTSNLLPEGSWNVEFEVIDESAAFAFYHFEIDISDKIDFSNILISKASLSDIINWSWEKNKDEFVDMDQGGVASNYVGRKVRYSSNDLEKLPRADVLYIRVRQRDNATFFSYRTFQDIIST